MCKYQARMRPFRIILSERRTLTHPPLSQLYHRPYLLQDDRRPGSVSDISISRMIKKCQINTVEISWLTLRTSSISQTLSTTPFNVPSSTNCRTKLKFRKLMFPEWKNDRRGTPPSTTGCTPCINQKSTKLVMLNSQIIVPMRPESGARWDLDMLPAKAKDPLGLRYAGQCWKRRGSEPVISIIESKATDEWCSIRYLWRSGCCV